MSEDEFWSEVDDAMLALGWTPSTTPPYAVDPMHGSFIRPLAGGLLSIAHIDYWEPDDDDRRRRRTAPRATVTGDVGVTSGPAQRLLVVVERRWARAAVYEDAGLVLGRGELRYDLATDADLSSVVRSLTGTVDEAARVFGERIATIDELIAAMRDDPDYARGEADSVPILLAAAGRGGEARDALRTYAESAQDPEYAAFRRRLEAFLDSGRKIPGPGDDVFAARPTRPSSWERPTLESLLARRRIRDEAWAAVRDRGEDLSPQQRRDALRRELEARGLEESPFHAEQRADAKDAARRSPASTWIALARIGKDAVDAWRGKVGASAVHGPSTGRRYEVLLDDGCERLLEDVFAGPVMRIGDGATLDATLRWRPDDGAPVDVLIGGSVVGRLYSERGRAEADARVRAHMGDVTVRAHLLRTRHAPRFGLEIEL
jgi:hypothetical protein